MNKQRLEYSGAVVPIMKWLHSIPKCKAINTHGSVYSERGTPDIIGCVQGRAFVLECKKDETEQERQLQTWRLSEWAASGAIFGRVDSLEQVQWLFKENGVAFD